MSIKLSNFVKPIAGAATKAKLKATKHSADIWMFVGIGSIFGAVGAACYGTVKATSIANDASEMVDTIHTTAERTDEETYSELDKKKDLAIVYTQTAIKFAKAYAPCFGFTALSIASFCTSHKIMKKRNAALAAAYATIDAGFKEYRNNVVDRFGEQVDKELRYNIKAREVEVTETNPDTGEVTTKTETVKAADIHEHSSYARVFEEGNRNWEKNAEYNAMFLKSRQNWANDYLIAHKILFLNDVYKELGFEPTRAGQEVGWVYDPNNAKCIGDNFVDFGIFKYGEPQTKAFIDSVTGKACPVVLDFNVDGYVLDKI